MLQPLAGFAVHISEKVHGNDTAMAQIENNTREQALKADLPDAATDVEETRFA